MASPKVLRSLLVSRPCTSVSAHQARILIPFTHSLSKRGPFEKALSTHCGLRSKSQRNCRPKVLGELLPTARSARRFLHTNPRSRRERSIGAEPGSDISVRDGRSGSSSAQSDNSVEIKIIDYSDKNIEQHEVTKSDLENFLRTRSKPDWAASRWIFVNGLDPEVLQCLGRSKNLHRLAIEDVLDTTTPTKVDWYDDHCFMEMPLQKLVHLQQEPRSSQNVSKQPSSDSAEPAIMELMERSRKWRTLSHREFGVSVEQVSAFLTSDNTVITIFEHSGQDVLTPILKRLQSTQTIIRSSNDPSMLIQAVIDAVVDLSLPIGKAVSDAFNRLELTVLTDPRIEQSKQLYLLRSGLTLLMDNINALDSLLRTLIDHRAAQLPTGLVEGSSAGYLNTRKTPEGVSLSPLATLYIHDVLDHVRMLSASTHMSIRSSENLTSLIFNTIAASQNESVRQLTLVSCFFLPLTFLTGYFGMNFDPMPIVNDYSDKVFWVIATPVMAITVTLLVARARWFRFRWMRRRQNAGQR